MDDKKPEEKETPTLLRELDFMQAIAELVEEFYPDGVDAGELSRAVEWAQKKFGRDPFAPPGFAFPPSMKMEVTHKDEPTFPKED